MVRLGRAVTLCAECVMDLMFVSTRTEAVLADALTVILARNAQTVSTFLVILCEMFSYFGIYQNVVQLSFTQITNICIHMISKDEYLFGGIVVGSLLDIR